MRYCLIAAITIFSAAAAAATPEFIEHNATQSVFGEPSGVTMREPDVVREDEAAQIWIRIAYSFFYTDVAIYYTTDGSEPFGAFGTVSPGTSMLRSSLGEIQFVRNEPSGGGNIDWWRAEFPASLHPFARTIRYKIAAWHGFGGPEIFANNYGCADGQCDNPTAPQTTFSYTTRLAWPGGGAGSPNPAEGYPPVYFWKEEAIFGNTYTAGMIDQNGTLYDMHFPSVGGVYGVGTRNEGYVDGLDTFPPGLPQGWRGQMHVNQAMFGIRVNDVTYWSSNAGGVGYSGIQQNYDPASNVILTSGFLTGGGNNIRVEQADFAPIGISFPEDQGGNPQRHIYLKRLTLTNQSATPATVNVYWYLDPALNGGDGYDVMDVDSIRGAIIAYDNTYRVVSGTGASFPPTEEYNPTTDAGYEKDVSVYLAAAMKVLSAPGASGGAAATDSWRDTSGDNGQGWIGRQVELPPGQDVEVNFVMVGGFDDFAGASGTYSYQLAGVLDWFLTGSVGSVQTATQAYWENWLADGVRFSSSDDAGGDFERLFDRGLLATALHVDAVNGGVIAGFHNGAYPYVWPRDAVYAAVTLARTGHWPEARNVYRWMREVTFRPFESWGRKGFWRQKYSTDGYVIWGAPQIDETAVFPWGVRYHYDITGDASVLSENVEQLRDAVDAMTRDSSDPRLRYEEAFNLVYSNNVWEDSYDTFIYSNANVWRGLEDARTAFATLSLPADAANAAFWRDQIRGGLDARLDWDGENTDISQLGIVYPFAVYAADDFRAVRIIDRINGVRTRFNNAHPFSEPLVNFAGEFQDLIDRYWCDRYWNGALTPPNCPPGGEPTGTPWFLSTMWYGLYYAERQDFTAGKADIDNHKYRLDRCIEFLGPVGLGAEQIAPAGSLLYPGQTDFVLQTAWPNAWESMSTFVDSIMYFLDLRPDAAANTLRIEPKLPTDWSEMTFSNVRLASHSIDIQVSEDTRGTTHRFVNRSGAAVNVDTVLRIPGGATVCAVTANGANIAYTHDAATGRVRVVGPLAAGLNAVTLVKAHLRKPADLDGNGSVDIADLAVLLSNFGTASGATAAQGDLDADGDVELADLAIMLAGFGATCP